MSFKNHQCSIDELDFYDDVFPKEEDPDKKLSLFANFNKWIRMQTVITPKVPNLIFRSNKATTNAAKIHIFSKYWYIIHPFSNFRYFWNKVMATVYFMAYIIIPLNLINRNTNYLSYIQIIIDLISIADIGINFISGYNIEETNEVIMRGPAIVHKYLSGYFLMDVISSIPVITGVSIYLDLFKVFKIVRIQTAKRYIHSIFTQHGFAHNYALLEFTAIILTSFFLIHWTTSAIIIIPLLKVHYNQDMTHSWILTDNVLDQLERGHISSAYGQALMCAVSLLAGDLSSMKKPESSIDFITCIFIIILGYSFFAYMMVLVVNYFITSNSSLIRYQAIMDHLRTFMVHHHMSERLQNRLISYYEYKYRYRYFEDNFIMALLPDHLKLEVSLHGCHKLLQNVKIFKNLPRDVLAEITNNMEPVIFLPNDVLVKAGTRGMCMYFLTTGTVAVLTPNGREVCHLEDGAHFGEVALLKRDNRRMASIIAIEFCEVFRLSSHNFRQCVLSCAELAERLRTIATGREDVTTLMDRARKREASMYSSST